MLILTYIVIVLLLLIIILIANYALSSNNVREQTLSTYECGFEAIDLNHKAYTIQFYLVALLFLLFDLELLFLFPLATIITHKIPLIFGLIFFVLLTIGFCYEWKKGALNY